MTAHLRDTSAVAALDADVRGLEHALGFPGARGECFHLDRGAVKGKKVRSTLGLASTACA